MSKEIFFRIDVTVKCEHDEKAVVGNEVCARYIITILIILSAVKSTSMSSYLMHCLPWWILGFLWHVGMLMAVTTVLFWRRFSNADVVAVGVASLYLGGNLYLTRRFHMYEMEKLQQQQQQSTVSDEASVTEATPTTTVVASSPSSSRNSHNPSIRLRTIPLYLSLTYLFTHMSWGIPGGLCVFLWFPCGDPTYAAPPAERYWITDTSNFSTQVLDWMRNPQMRMLDSFVQLGSEVYLKGSYEGSDDALYAVRCGEEPIDLGYRNVFDLTRIDNETMCFVQVDYLSQRLGGFDPNIRIGCGSFAAGFTTAVVNQEQRGNRHENVALFSLRGMEGLLWFRLVTEDYNVGRPFWGSPVRCSFDAILNYDRVYDVSNIDCPWDSFAVLSMNTTTMQVTSYSNRYTRVHPQATETNVGSTAMTEGTDPDLIQDDFISENGNRSSSLIDDFFEDDPNDNAEEESYDPSGSEIEPQEPSSLFCPNHRFMTAQRALGALFLSALPMVIASARAWIKSAIPSASVSLFVGIGILCTFVWATIDPWEVGSDGLLAWLWFGTPLWTIVCTYQLVVNPRVSRPPLWWSLCFILTGLLLMLLFAEYTDLSRSEYFVGDRMWAWALELALYDFPTLIIAILTDSMYFFALSAIAFASQASTVAWLTSNPPTAYVHVTVANVIILVVFVGIFRSREALHRRFVRWLSACARHTCAVEAIDDDEDEHVQGSDTDEMNTTGLLHNETAEEA